MRFILVFIFTLVVVEVRAEVCKTLTSAQEVLDCALERHPSVMQARGVNDQGESIEGIARQLPNPELNSRAVYGSNFGTRVGSTELSLTHNFELGGKRSARIDKAVATRQEKSSLYQKTKEEIFISTAKNLYHIRHLMAEVDILNEALATFTKIHKQYKSRPTLNPEQQVNSSIFQLAEGDYRLRKAQAEAELNELERHLEISVGGFLKISDKILPPIKTSWPSISEDSPLELPGSAEWRLGESVLKEAKAELDLAKSTSWPDLKIGPAVVFETEATNTFSTYGLTLTMQLPLYHINGAGRSYAYQGLSLADKGFEAKKFELNRERKALVVRYQKSLKALQEATTHTEIEKKHKNIESLFQRGVVASSLVIEAHRQLVDFTKSKNEQELDTLETYWKIKAFEGKLLDLKL